MSSSSVRSSRHRVVALLAAGVLALGAAACSKKESTSSTGTTAAPATTAVTGTTAASGKKHSDASKAELEKWQTDLNAVGCWAGPVDGQLGPETEAAIKEFQQAEGLTVDGLLGSQTERALEAAVKAGKRVCTGGAGTTTSTAPGSTTTTPAGSTTTTKP